MSERFGGVLCAGLGTRMAPLTHVLPKPLLPFLNTPLITYAMADLMRAGVSRVAMNLHHLADAIPPVVDRLAPLFQLSPVYAREWELMGTAGGARGLLRALGEPAGATLILTNGDSVMDVDLGAHADAHVASGRAITMLTRPKQPGQPGRVFVDAAGQLQGIRHYRRPHAPPDSALIEVEFTGVHFIQTDTLRALELECGDLIDELHGPMLLRDEAIGVATLDGFWAALDNPGLLIDAQRRVLSEPGLLALAPMPAPLAPGLFILNQPGVHDKAQLAGPVFLGQHVTIGAGAKIGPNVVLDGVEVAPGAVLKDCMLYGMGTIEGEWRDCLGVAGQVSAVAR